MAKIELIKINKDVMSEHFKLTSAMESSEPETKSFADLAHRAQLRNDLK